VCTARTSADQTISPELRELIAARAQETAESLPELTPRQKQVVRSCLGDRVSPSAAR
jgi:hypothetical protein